MSIEDIIKRTGNSPITIERLVSDLRALGVEPGMALLVHSSLSKIGFVCGGAQAVVMALQEVIGDEGTLMMPSMSGDWSDPKPWEAPSVPESWWPVIREHWPAWDPALSQTREMGAIVDTFLKQHDVIRSQHPASSFAARGPNAQQLTCQHNLPDSMGDTSPLGILNKLDGHVLLLGVGYANNSSLHLAEYRSTYASKTTRTQGAAMLVDGKRIWVKYEQFALTDKDFVQVGEALESQTDHTTVGRIGLAESRLMRQRPLVDFATDWMNKNR